MEILLLHVACLTLEAAVTWPSIDIDTTRDDAHGHTTGEHVKESCFTGTRSTLAEISERASSGSESLWLLPSELSMSQA